jgi:Flp pilus assembly protein TadD
MDNRSFAQPLVRTIYAAEHAMSGRQFKRAVDLYTSVIDDPGAKQLQPELLTGCYISRAVALRREDRPMDALRDCEMAIMLNPRNFKPHLNAALIYAQDLDCYTEAIGEFDKAIALNPTNVDSLSSRGLTKMLNGDEAGAEKDLRMALSIDPKNSDALCNLGNLYFSCGQYREAAEQYQKALEVNPSDVEIRVNLVLVMEHLGMHRVAQTILRKDKRAVELWKRKGGQVDMTPTDFTFAFIKSIAPLYGLIMSGATLFMTASLSAMPTGFLIGAALGTVIALILAAYARNRPPHEWRRSPNSDMDLSIGPFSPPKMTYVEMRTGVIAGFLGVIFGAVHAFIIMNIFPIPNPSSWVLGPLMGFAAGGMVSFVFRKIGM